MIIIEWVNESNERRRRFCAYEKDAIRYVALIHTISKPRLMTWKAISVEDMLALFSEPPQTPF